MEFYDKILLIQSNNNLNSKQIRLLIGRKLKGDPMRIILILSLFNYW